MEKTRTFDKKNVLVIGGAGFIGSHLCDELVKKCRVVCLDNFSSGDEKNIDHLLSDENFKFIRHDISEPLDLRNYPELAPFKIEFQGIHEIYNCACPTSPKYFDQNKIATLLANSYGVKNGLDLAVKYGAKFLHFSSSVIYGPRREGNPRIKENDLGAVDLLSPRSSYDEGKRFAETMVMNYRDVNKLDTRIIRLFRIYGPRMKLNDGQMIPDFIVAALDNRDLLIQGDEKFSSSFCYVSDVIDASRKIMEHDYTGPVNIGSDQDVNLTELANKIIKMTGSKSKVTYQEKQLFYTELSLPNTDLARNELGWLPIMTLEKGLEKTIYDLRASKGIVDFKTNI
jgi:UDP-glucuronate decarboxylase